MAKPGRQKPRQKREDPVLDRVLDELLNGKVDVIPKFTDLPRRWREAPEKESDREHPWDPTKDELLGKFIGLAVTQQFAREELRRLYDELTTNGEPIPDLLQGWNDILSVLGDPPSRPGPRRKVDRDGWAGVAFKLLGVYGYTREEAIARIAETLGVSDETIRTAINKNRIHLGPPQEFGLIFTLTNRQPVRTLEAI